MAQPLFVYATRALGSLFAVSLLASLSGCASDASNPAGNEPATSADAEGTTPTNAASDLFSWHRRSRLHTWQGATDTSMNSAAPDPTTVTTTGSSASGSSASGSDTSGTTGSTGSTGSTTGSSGGTGSDPGSTPTQPSAPAMPAAFHGVNLSGAEFGGALPGTFGTDYTFPNSTEVDYYMGKGLTTFRIPFMWERVQPNQYGSFDSAYTGRLDTLVTTITNKGGYVVLNPQNFARYYNTLIGSSSVPNAVFADFWGKMAAKYAGNAHVMFDLVNEPNTMSTEQWVSAANAAIAAIRNAGATNVIIVPGNNWTGAYSWDENFYGTPNSVALLNIVDPGNNVLFEAHQYLDSNDGGQSDQCVSSTIGSQRLQPWVQWLRANGKKGFLGEFAGGRNSTCYAAIKDMLDYVKANSDVVVGELWWGAGPWWGSSYAFALDPISGVDQPPMSILTQYLY